MTVQRPLAPANHPLSRHDFYLVYPFKTGVQGVDALTSWQIYTERLDRLQKKREEHDLYALLPDARNSHYNKFIAESEEERVCSRLARGYRRGVNSIRLTLVASERCKYFPDQATIYRADRTRHMFAIDVHWIDVVLYPPGYGFLTIKITTNGLTVEEAGVVHRSIKKVYFRERLRVSPAKLHFGEQLESNWPGLLNGLLAEFGVDIASDFAQTHAASFHVVSLALGSMLRDDGVAYGNIKGSEEGHLIALITGEDLSTISHPGRDLVHAARHGRLNYWRDWSGLLLWDDMAFIGKDTEFTKTHLVHNVEALYLPLFILALFQHLRLHEISMELAELAIERQAKGVGNLKQLEKLNTNLRFFRSNYMFWEISRQPVMSALFTRLLGYFETDKQFDQIEHNIERIYLEERARAQERLTRFASVATFFALPIGALLAIFSGSVASFFGSTSLRWMLFALVATASSVGWLMATGHGSRLGLLKKKFKKLLDQLRRVKVEDASRRVLFGTANRSR